MYVWREFVGDEFVWSAQIPEIRLSASAGSRADVIESARESLAVEFPGQAHHLDIHDCLAPA